MVFRFLGRDGCISLGSTKAENPFGNAFLGGFTIPTPASGYGRDVYLDTLFKHKEKDITLCSHVGHLAVGGERIAIERLVSAVKSKLTVQGGEFMPSPTQDGLDPVPLLEKRHYSFRRG